MTKQEFRDKLNNLKIEYDDKTLEIVTEYALSHNVVEIGDIIFDHYQTIMVEKIEVKSNGMYDFPGCLYTGQLLKKDLKPFKRGNIANVWQGNIQKVLRYGRIIFQKGV